MEFNSSNRSEVCRFKWMFLLCTWEKSSKSIWKKSFQANKSVLSSELEDLLCWSVKKNNKKIDNRTHKEYTNFKCAAVLPDESVPVRSDGLETETFLVNILSADSLADSSEDKEHLISHRHHVIQCVCVCDFVPSDPDPKESRACEAVDKVCVCVFIFLKNARGQRQGE